MIKPLARIDQYDWDDICKELCKVIGIEESKFRDYHEVIGGSYKDLWPVCLETFIPDNMSNDSIVLLFNVDDTWFDGEEAWKNVVLTAWKKVYESIVGVDEDPGIYVNFCW